MIEWKQMTMQEAENKMEVLREIFDVVRLLKGSDLQAAGMESKLAGKKYLCQFIDVVRNCRQHEQQENIQNGRMPEEEK